MVARPALDVAPVPLDVGRANIAIEGTFDATLARDGVGCSRWNDAPMFSVQSGRTTRPAWSFRVFPQDPPTDPARAVNMPSHEVFFTFDGITYKAALTEPGGFALSDEGLTLTRLGLTSQDGRSVTVTADVRCPSPVPPPPETVVTILRSVSERATRPYSTYEFGRKRYACCASVLVPEDDALDLVDVLRRRLPDGWTAWIGTSNFVDDPELRGTVEVVVGPARTGRDIVLLAHVDPVNHDLQSIDVAEAVARWESTWRIDVVQADVESVTARIPPDVQIDRLAAEVAALCPDVVEQGVETVAALEETMRRTSELYCWWD